MAGMVGGVVGGLVGAVAVTLASRGRRSSIRRLHTGDPRSSGVLVHKDIVYLSGQVGIIENVGTNKSNILEARIWLKDIKRDFAAMNGVWNAWVDQENKGVRYCVESHLARENLLVEIQIVATI